MHKGLLKALTVPVLVLYPALVAGALLYEVPISVCPLLLVFVAGTTAFGAKIRGVWIIALILAAALFFTAEPIFLKLYPVLMNTAVAGIFFSSLFKKPLIAVFAEKMGYVLDDAGHAYTHKATIAWGIFMSANALVSLGTVFTHLHFWAIYNGGISYLLIGLMMLGEYCVRRKTQCKPL